MVAILEHARAVPEPRGWEESLPDLVFTCALEEGCPPDVAWTLCFGAGSAGRVKNWRASARKALGLPLERPVGETGPDGLYRRLLEAGVAPDRAFAATFERALGESYSETMSTKSRGAISVRGTMPRPPAMYVDGCHTSFTPPAELEGTATVFSAMSGVAGYVRAHLEDVQPGMSTIPGKEYGTYVYCVEYWSRADLHLTFSVKDGAVSASVAPKKTFLRINLPCQLPDEPVGVVLMVDGWAGEQALSCAVRLREAQTNLVQPMAVLTSGISYGEEISIEPDWAPLLAYREGPPMVTVGFTQPGRGLSTDVASDGDTYEADGDSEFVNSTPENPTGMDYGGLLTFDAMEAVMCVVRDLLADRLGVDAGSVTDHVRIVVLSESGGITSASRWVANTGFPVHALVDWEGPSDSLSRTGALRRAVQIQFEADPTASQYETPQVYFADYPTWEAEFVGRGDLFHFRPPLELIVLDGGYWMPESGGILEEYFLFWWLLGIVDADALSWIAYWSSWYWFGYDVEDTVAWLREFWKEREAVYHLPRLAGRACAYCRIQTSNDHGTWDQVNGWHAIRALNAAYWSGTNPNVFYTTFDYFVGLAAGHPVGLAPTTMPGDFDESMVFQSGYGGWPEWRQEVLIKDTEKWVAMVDLVRWSMGEEFTYPYVWDR